MAPFFLSPTAEIYETVSQASKVHISVIAKVQKLDLGQIYRLQWKIKWALWRMLTFWSRSPHTQTSRKVVFGQFYSGWTIKVLWQYTTRSSMSRAKRCSSHLRWRLALFRSLKMAAGSVQVDVLINDSPHSNCRASCRRCAELGAFKKVVSEMVLLF